MSHVKREEIKMFFHLFLFDQYYPCGGMNDWCGEFYSLESALEAAKDSGRDKYQVVSFSGSSYEILDSGLVKAL